MPGRAKIALEHQRFRLFGPVVLVCLAAIAVLVLSSFFLIDSFDQSARQREEQMVANGVELRITEFATAAVPQLDWDDAVANLDHQFSAEWADQNVSSFLFTVNGFTEAFVLDGSDRPIYAAKQSVRGKPGDFAGFSAAAAPMLPDIRRQEAARKPLSPSPDGTSMISQPIQAKGIAAIRGQPFIVVATLVQPDFGSVMPSARAPIVVTAVPIDQALLTPFANRYLLEDLKLAQHDQTVGERAAFWLEDSQGKPVAGLTWLPERPGTTLIGRLGISIAAGVMALLVIAWSMARSAMAIANDLISSEARARHLAHHDTLTQLPNRALMFERARQLFAAARRSGEAVAVHCLDLDRFKEVNDTLGHNAGDELIQEVAKRLCGVCRDTDTIARLGGDEFVILQPATDARGAAKLTDRVFEALREPFDLEFGSVEIGCSIGITLIGADPIEPVEALRQADLALYRSKDAGRQRATFFEPEMDAALRMRRSLELDLRRALAEEALEMVYQPQVDHSGTIRGVEALVRWHHPERGAVPPGLFVALAEETGLIHDLGNFVFRRAFAETAEWQGLRVAINVSAVQLRSAALIPSLNRILQEAKVSPGNYEIELTETALLGDDPITRKNIERLKRMGFSIALDDFGTGYSSLSVLQRFSVDKIKIDTSFVKNLVASEESEALVDAMIKLARALDLDVIAEGVETQAQRDRLESCGCHDFQGYLMSKPIGARAVERLVAKSLRAA